MHVPDLHTCLMDIQKKLNNASVETEERSYGLTTFRNLVLYASSTLIFKVNTRFIKIYLPYGMAAIYNPPHKPH